MTHDVFISYSSKQQAIAVDICEYLEHNGMNCWMAPRDIPPGSFYGDLIANAIMDCKVVVLVYSQTASSSIWVNGEVNAAFSNKKPIIPFRVDNTEIKGSFLVMLNQMHWIDAFPDYKGQLHRLLQSVKTMIEGENGTNSTDDGLNDKNGNGRKMLLWMILAVIAIVLSCIFVINKQKESLVGPPIMTAPSGENSQDSSSDTLFVSNDEISFEIRGVTFTLKYIEGGTFQMGATIEQGTVDPMEDEKPVHNVTVSSFYIGETEITQALWRLVMDNEPSNNGGWSAQNGRGDFYPAYLVSWNDCKKFIEKLNKLTGKQFRLPTEAEWEFAARGGNMSGHFKYAGSNVVGDVSCHKDNSGGLTHPVKEAKPNELGLFDMSGNVWEWCEDGFGDYSLEAQINPVCSKSCSYKVLRGGSWNSVAAGCRVSTRFAGECNIHEPFYGFRVVLPQ